MKKRQKRKRKGRGGNGHSPVTRRDVAMAVEVSCDRAARAARNQDVARAFQLLGGTVSSIAQHVRGWSPNIGDVFRRTGGML